MDKPRREMSFRSKAVLWAVLSLVAGLVGGWIAEFLTAPFYFGFLMMWVLIGLIGMFVLAAHVTEQQRKGP